jgi:hypothetical protein
MEGLLCFLFLLDSFSCFVSCVLFVGSFWLFVNAVCEFFPRFLFSFEVPGASGRVLLIVWLLLLLLFFGLSPSELQVLPTFTLFVS